MLRLVFISNRLGIGWMKIKSSDLSMSCVTIVGRRAPWYDNPDKSKNGQNDRLTSSKNP